MDFFLIPLVVTPRDSDAAALGRRQAALAERITDTGVDPSLAMSFKRKHEPAVPSAIKQLFSSEALLHFETRRLFGRPASLDRQP